MIDQSHLTTAEQDYLDVLSDLVEAYETEAVKIRPVSDAQLLKFLIEEKGDTQAKVATGAKIAESTISEVLARKRKLNRKQIEKLSRYFRVEVAAFLPAT